MAVAPSFEEIMGLTPCFGNTLASRESTRPNSACSLLRRLEQGVLHAFSAGADGTFGSVSRGDWIALENKKMLQSLRLPHAGIPFTSSKWGHAWPAIAAP